MPAKTKTEMQNQSLRPSHTAEPGSARASPWTATSTNLLGTLAKTNGTNRSAFIEQLILRADDLSLDPQIQELLGVMAVRANMTRTQVLGDAGTEGRCCRNLAASPAETEALVEALGQTGVGRTSRTFGEPDSGGCNLPAVVPRQTPVRMRA